MTLSRKEMVKKAALDVLKAFIIGVAAAAATAVILFACGFLFGSFQIVNGFEVVKDGLLLIGAIGLFLVAGMLLAKGKKENADEKIRVKTLSLGVIVPDKFYELTRKNEDMSLFSP